MTIRRFGQGTRADQVRAISPPPPTEAVAAILSAVSQRGDTAVREFEQQFGTPARESVVARELISSAPSELDPALLDALKLSIENVRAVAAARIEEDEPIDLPQGQSVTYRTLPVARAAAYVPGGRGSYPSTAVMCLATAREAGVEQICVLSPAREGGEVAKSVLAVCALLGVEEVHAIGGAQAIGAAAYGTESIDSVDVIVGPGNSFVQEAKRQLVGRVGIDSVAGPSELVVVADSTAPHDAVALDLLAQSEHGPDSLVVLITPDPSLGDAIEQRCAEIESTLAIVSTRDLNEAVALADEIAPEHLQLMISEDVVEGFAPLVRQAGALFVGHVAATAFGDYVAGSNHVLPTGGAARFSSALSVDTFRRRMAEVRIPRESVEALSDAGALIARGEGFNHHAESMEARRSD